MGSVVKPHITVVYLFVGIAMLWCDVFIQYIYIYIYIYIGVVP